MKKYRCRSASTTPKLIIDASFQIFFDESPVTAETVVKLRLSADYFDESIPTVTNASVFLTNLSNGNIINFNDANLDGDYEPTNSFIPEENTTYELTVVYDNETYKATAARVKSTPLTNVIQGDETLFSGEETEIQIFFTDDGSIDNYYVFDFSNALYLALEDRFFNGADYSFLAFIKKMKLSYQQQLLLKCLEYLKSTILTSIF